jgi:hypothetical protein
MWLPHLEKKNRRQSMSRSIVTLMDCPFCEEYGEVYLDSRAATEQNLANLHADNSDAGISSGILVYNANRPEPGPCEHLVNINGSIESWCAEKDRHLESPLTCPFDWYAPLLTALDPGEEGWQLLLSLTECQMPTSSDTPQVLIEERKRFLADNRPKTPYLECKFDECVEDVTSKKAGREILVYGSAVFAANIAKLFEELKCARKRLASNASL